MAASRNSPVSSKSREVMWAVEGVILNCWICFSFGIDICFYKNRGDEGMYLSWSECANYF